MSSNHAGNLAALEYRDVSILHAAATLQAATVVLVPGVPEHEVERREAAARQAATTAAEERLRAANAARQAESSQQLKQQLAKFERERATYFSRVEAEIVQLALAIARKILQRESELDPTLLAGLVRIALDRMQSGTEVRIQVAPSDAEMWRASAAGPAGAARWQVEEDASLGHGDCVVVTDMGKANFGLEAQLGDIEQTFRGLLAHKPSAL